MRLPDDYMGEMPTKELFDREIELLLAGTPVEGGRLSGLAPVVEMIRTQSTPAPPESEIAHFARNAASAVKLTQPRARAVTTVPPRWLSPRLDPTWRRATVALAVLLMSGTAGMAMAADSAVPGDALYGVDRAFEQVGIGSGSADERLDEAVVMAAQGRSAEALAHAIDALSQQAEDSSIMAVSALIIASENLVDTQDTAEAASVASVRVTALLTYIAENIGIDVGTDGREFGQGVAELARGIGTGDDPTGAPNPAVAPGPGQGQSNDPGAGPANEGTNDGTGPADGNSNGNGSENGQDNGPPVESPSVTAPGQDHGPPVESPSVTAPTEDNGPPVESPSVTTPGRGTNTEDSPAATAPGKQNQP
jgi:hypothetical protein